ncbi:MAG: hypothetical protein KAI76_00260, partial [Alphaproteobacteria bacterium]|nr:hypothetical protein [Alphaproteobacteria bacterium]
GDFDKNYPTTEVEEVVSKTGAGNGVEGVLFGHLLGKIGTTGQSLEKNMDIVANLGNAAASVVIGKNESYLTEDDHGSILKNYRNIVINNAHSLESMEPAVPIKHSNVSKKFQM